MILKSNKILMAAVSLLLCSCNSSDDLFTLAGAGTGGQATTTNGALLLREVSGPLQSAADQLFSNPHSPFANAGPKLESCDSDDTGLIVVFSTNSKAHSGIDVKLDGHLVGSLNSYFPDDSPSCEGNTKGAINLVVPSGNHAIEATSSNIVWPNHTFSVGKCKCLLLPLS
ncbi:MAG: hypothetical protein OEZ68_16415 [Gammaproteobacteria bacterium]|nr:hypothetical protein [Gammaproteobacteria bacterium]MDH5802386.1 hypothetical protein [Gammaproteobacteria bacterium]